jgi:uncharacterized surface protein with fasciclin (FAS1) repeats
MKRRLWLVCAAAVLASGCASMDSAPVDIAATAAASPDLTILSKAIQVAGLTDTLKGPGPFTVFAPNDAAFRALPKGTLDKLLADPGTLRQVLTYHVVPGKVMAADVKTGPVKSVQGAPLALSRAGTFVTVEDGAVIKGDIQATNGVIHVIDSVLLPPLKKK